MKRSYVNEVLRKTKKALEEYQIKLPEFAYYSLKEWEKVNYETIAKTMLGWDITDFGSNKFLEVGTVLFSLRNGDQKDTSIGTPYAEKMLFIHDGQRLPCHCHHKKTEDIINRGGGDMSIKLFISQADGNPDNNSDVTVYCDGIKRIVKAGEEIIITRGNSITLVPGMYHTFGAKKGTGDLIAWEVSSVNDDNADNCFFDEVKRFSQIEEDEAPLHILCNEYLKFLK